MNLKVPCSNFFTKNKIIIFLFFKVYPEYYYELLMLDSCCMT